MRTTHRTSTALPWLRRPDYPRGGAILLQGLFLPPEVGGVPGEAGGEGLFRDGSDPKRLVDALRCVRQLAQHGTAWCQGVRDSAGDGPERTDGAGLSDALAAERGSRAWRFEVLQLDGGHVRRNRHQVLHQGWRPWLAIVRMDGLLEEHLADAHGDSPSKLALDRTLIDDRAAVLDRDVAKDPGGGGCRVDLHDSQVRPGAKDLLRFHSSRDVGARLEVTLCDLAAGGNHAVQDPHTAAADEGAGPGRASFGVAQQQVHPT